MIRTAFFGTPEFAVPSLTALVEHPEIEVSLVVTQPDRPAGRGRGVRSPAVKQAAEVHALPIIQPETMRDPSAIEQLRDARPDVIVVVSYGEILRRAVIELPDHGCLNVHPSLLPAYRGSSPIPAAILNGDPQTGVSIMKLVRQMDAGPVIRQIRVELDGTETAGELADQLASLAAEHLPDTVLQWVEGGLPEQPQDHGRATYTRELRKSDAQVDWTDSSAYIERFVRAMDPWPKAWTVMGGNRLVLHQLRVPTTTSTPLDESDPGALIVDGDAVYARTGDGVLELVTVQPGGKKPMPATDWLRGARIEERAAFELPDERPPIVYRR